MPSPTSCRSSDPPPQTSLPPPAKHGGGQPFLSGPQPRPAPERQAALPIPNAENLLCVLLTVGRGGDDEQAVQEVDGDAMRALVAGTPDAGEEGGKGGLSG